MPVILKSVESMKFQRKDSIIHFIYVYFKLLMYNGFETCKSLFKHLFTNIFLER